MTEPNDYDDLPFDGLGEVKEIRRINGMRKVAPKVRWGPDYLGKTEAEKVVYLEKFGAAMNHAADILQNERGGLIETAKDQERKIKSLHVKIQELQQVLQKALDGHNAEKQQLCQEIVQLATTVKERGKEIKSLKAEVRALERRADGGLD